MKMSGRLMKLRWWQRRISNEQKAVLELLDRLETDGNLDLVFEAKKRMRQLNKAIASELELGATVINFYVLISCIFSGLIILMAISIIFIR